MVWEVLGLKHRVAHLVASGPLSDGMVQLRRDSDPAHRGGSMSRTKRRRAGTRLWRVRMKADRLWQEDELFALAKLVNPLPSGCAGANLGMIPAISNLGKVAAICCASWLPATPSQQPCAP